MGFTFDEQSVKRIQRAVIGFERQAGSPIVVPTPKVPTSRFIFGKLDASWKRDTADDETEVDLSVYTPGWDDANFNIKVKPGNLHGYLYQGTWCLCVDDGTAWRIVYPVGGTIFGQWDTTCAKDAKQTFSVYYHTSSGVWTDTGDNIATTDATPVYNTSGASVTAGKRATATLDPRGMVFCGGPLECE